MVSIRCFSLRFTHSLASRHLCRLLPALRPAPCSDITRTTCPVVLRSRSITLLSLLLRPHVPVPKPLTNFAFTLVDQSLQLGPSAAGLQDLPDLSSRESFPGCLHLYSGGLWSALARFFLQSIGLPQNGSRSALSKSPHNDFCAGPLFRSCSHSLMFRPPGLFATQVVPTDATCAHGGHDFYFRAPYGSLLPHTSDMLAVRFRAIDGRGLSPHKIRGVVGRIHRFNGFRPFRKHEATGLKPRCE